MHTAYNLYTYYLYCRYIYIYIRMRIGGPILSQIPYEDSSTMYIKEPMSPTETHLYQNVALAHATETNVESWSVTMKQNFGPRCWNHCFE